MTIHPKVFISYSHDNEEHRTWVLDLATNMRKHGVDVILDQWELQIGSDLRFFMEQGLSESKFVVCVCSEQYVQKANSGNSGVGYESTIISNNLLIDSNIDYILPVIKNNPSSKKTPFFLFNKLYADFDKEHYSDAYGKLIAKIYGEALDKKPPLGNNPFKNQYAPIIQMKTDCEKNSYRSLKNHGIIETDYSKNDGIYSIGTGSFSFDTLWSGCSQNAIYAYSDHVKAVGYIDNFKKFPQNEELIYFDYTSRVVTVFKNEIVIFENMYGNFLAAKILDIKSKSHGQEKNYLKFEYRIVGGLL